MKCPLDSGDFSIILVCFNLDSRSPIFFKGAPHYLKLDLAPVEPNYHISCFCVYIDHSGLRLGQKLLADLALN